MWPTIIISDKFETARVYAQMAGIKDGTWSYAMNRASFYGVRNPIIVKCGNYYHNQHWPEISNAISELKAKTDVHEVFIQ
jgi:hypothetical protein